VYKEYDVQKRYYGLGMAFDDVRDFQCEILVTEYMSRLPTKDIRQGHDHCSKLKLPREKDHSPTHYANVTYGGTDMEFVFYRIFLCLLNWKKRFC
jgi:hypothetical protein